MRLTSLSTISSAPILRAHGAILGGILIGLGAVNASAQVALRGDSASTSWVHEAWTVSDGLPVNSINGVLQSRSGYIWMATFDGLVRFDGVRFVVFNTANSSGLPSNRILWLSEASDSSLWMLTEQLHLVRFRNGAFTHVRPDEALGSANFAILFDDTTRAVWVATNRGVGRVKGDRIEAVAPETIHAPVSTISQRVGGGAWVATQGPGLFRVDSDDRVTRVPLIATLASDTITTIHEDADGTLWLGSIGGLWSGHDSLGRVTARGVPLRNVVRVVHAPNGEHVVATLSGVYRVASGVAVAEDPRPRLIYGATLWTDETSAWYATGAEVLRDGRRAFALPTDASAPLAPNTILAGMTDREGSLWLGTHAGGLHRLKRALFTVYSGAEGLAYRNVYSAYEDRAGAIWVGSWGRGASRIDSRGIENFGSSRGVPSIVNTFLEQPSGDFWIGGADGLRLCTRTPVSCARTGPPELRGTVVLALYGDTDGRLWVGSWAGLFRFDGRTWTRVDGSPAAQIRAFVQTRDGALWMATNGAGLARYREGRFTLLTAADGLPIDLVRSLYEDADGWLWVGTEGRGLARLDPRAWGAMAGGDRKIVRIGASDGLFDEVIHQILEDDAGRLWMSTNRGIFWVARAELNAFADGRAARVHSVGYTERDGLRNREANGGVYPAGTRSRDGRLWFPTQDGVAVVDPARVRRDSDSPPIVVERVVAQGAPLPRDSAGRIIVGHAQRDLQIEYTALTYVEPANVRFRYRLEGYDADWIDAGNRRTTFYTHVRPRTYTFRVEASDAEGGWYEPGATLELRVIPRVHETLWFRWSIALLAALVVTSLFRWRVAQLGRRALALEHVVAERTAALRQRELQLSEQNQRLEQQAVDLQALDHAKTRFFANVSHELRTPLTLTIGPLHDLREQAQGDPKIERWLDIALRNSRRLLRLVNQILDVAKLEAGQMRLSPRPLDLVPFTRGIVAAFAPVAERQGVDLRLEAPLSLGVVLDADGVEKIVTNLLSNAVRFTGRGGSVVVSWSRESHSVRLVVRDSGRGIPANQLAHVFERFYQVDESDGRRQAGTGIGLSLVRELVELQHGNVTVDSGSTGTTFTVTLPAGATTEPMVEAPARVDGPAALVTGEHESNGEASNEQPADGSEHAELPTLLVVDDSDDLRAWIRDHFVGRFHIIEAADGSRGVELAQRHLPDVVVSDVMMPGIDGHELVRTLRASAETDFVPVVLLTAQAEEEQKLAGLERGADDYMVKPFEMRELDVRIRNLIASRRRLREHLSHASDGVDAAPDRTVMSGLAPADRALMERVYSAIDRRLADAEFGVGELADAVAMDRSHLFRRTRELVGETPSELIRRVRLEAAARLLAQGTGTVADVAYAVGFSSVSHFSRSFHEKYGMTPASYRRRPVSG